MKHKIIINGESWCRNTTGIERLAIEVTQALDSLFSPEEAELVVPKNAKNLPNLKNIKIVILNENADFFPRWTQFSFQRYVITHHGISLDFSNTCPFFAPGVEFIHDIYAKLYPEDFKSRRDKLIRIYTLIMYKRIAKKAKRILTVSEYTKKTIIDTYKVNPNKIDVVYSGVSQYNEIKKDNTVFESLSIDKNSSYYFTLGSLSSRKNLKWIADHAELYPNELFIISGQSLLNFIIPPELEKLKQLKNVILAGYLKDEQVKALISACKAFIFPSYFEGFGLPPLEALSCGAKIIISNKTSLPEIYGDCAYYIDPERPDVNLDELLKTKVEEPSKLLDKYTLKNTALRIYNILEKL